MSVDAAPWVTPVSVYVISHPRSSGTLQLSNGLVRWLRLQVGQEAAPDAGLPVWVRRLVVQDGAGARLAPPIEFGQARLNVLVVLCDDDMAVDPRWWTALERVVSDGEAAAEAGRSAAALLAARTGVAAAAPIAQLLVLPVGVSDAVGRLGFLVATHQVIRLPPLGPDGARTSASTGEVASAQLRALRRGVMEAILRRLPASPGVSGHAALGRGGPGPTDPVADAVPAVKVFLSHAKKDGRLIAERLRDGLAHVSQVRPWFDANDLPAGADWAGRMTEAARAATDGLIAIVTDAYHSRYWCQREAQHARQPRRLSADARLWGVQPTVALIATGGGARRPVPALDGVLHLGWRSAEDLTRAAASTGPAATLTVRDAEEGAAAETIEDAVEWWLLEALLARVAERRGLDVLERAGGAGLAVLTFSPDPYTLGRLLGLWRLAGQGLPARICVPGHGMPRAARERLLEVLADHGYDEDAARVAILPLEALVHDRSLWALPALVWVDGRWTAKGSERVVERADQGGEGVAAAPVAPDPESAAPQTPASSRPAGLRVALSAGGDEGELAEKGVGMVHVDDLLVRISGALLDAGVRLAFGGLLRDKGAAPDVHNLTEPLLLAAQGWAAAAADAEAGTPEARAASLRRLHEPPLLNYVPWTEHGGPSLRFRAARAGACRFVDLPLDGGRRAQNDALVVERDACRAAPPAGDPVARDAWAGRLERLQDGITRAQADALTEMRRLSAQDCGVRVLMGGKIRGASGWLPSVAEELEASLWAHAVDDSPEASKWAPEHAHPVLLLGGFGGVCGVLAGYLRRSDERWPGALSGLVDREAIDGSIDGVRLARMNGLEALLDRFRAHLHGLSDADPVFPADGWTHATLTKASFMQLLTVESPTAALRLVRRVFGG